MHLVAAIIIILIAGTFFAHGVAKARAAGAPASPRAGKGKAARIPTARESARSAQAAAKTIWTQAKATNRLEEQRHRRTTGTAKPPGRTARGVRQAGRGARAFGRIIGSQVPRRAAPAAASTSPPPAAAPPPVPAAPPAPASPNGRNPAMATGNGSAEKLIEGVNQVHAEAGAGGIHAKHGAIKAANEGALRFAAMLSMMARATGGCSSR